jgi:hypothetical protein
LNRAAESAAKGSGGEKPPHFFMRKAIAASVVLVIVAACSSSTGSSQQKLKVPMPEILLVQTSSVPIAARHSDGALSIHYAMRVENRASEAITLRQVTVQSVSEGAYYVDPTSKPYDLVIEPLQKQEVEFWAAARPAGSIVGANGPVTLRVTCQFETIGGKFQHIVMQRVNERAAITGAQ